MFRGYASQGKLHQGFIQGLPVQEAALHACLVPKVLAYGVPIASVVELRETGIKQRLPPEMEAGAQQIGRSGLKRMEECGGNRGEDRLPAQQAEEAIDQ